MGFSIVTVKDKEGHAYGLEQIGSKNSHWRFRTPDNVKHRSAVAAVRHLKKLAVVQLGLAWGCTCSVA